MLFILRFRFPKSRPIMLSFFCRPSPVHRNRQWIREERVPATLEAGLLNITSFSHTALHLRSQTVNRNTQRKRELSITTFASKRKPLRWLASLYLLRLCQIYFSILWLFGTRAFYVMRMPKFIKSQLGLENNHARPRQPLFFGRFRFPKKAILAIHCRILVPGFGSY